VDIEISSGAFKADRYPFFARLRAETPVRRVRLPGRQTAWLIARYDDVAAVLKDPRFVKNRRTVQLPEQAAREPWMPAFLKPLSQNMLDLDEPDHTRLRALVTKSFTPRLVEHLRGRVERLANDLLDRVQGRGHMDLIRDYAIPVPTTIIAEMLGVPVEDRRRFQRWSRAVATALPSWCSIFTALPALWSFLRYIRKLVRARRQAPRDDLVTALVQAEEAGDQLSEDELLAMIFLLLFAGHETTVNLIGNGTLALLRHPSQLARLRGEPGLIRPAVEELLRYDPPLLTASERFTREDVTVAGVTIPRGEMVYAAIASANRDERQFANPDTLDITREPNRHLSFGLGAHFCGGAALARMEGQIAVGTLLRRTSGLQLAVPPEALRWRRGLVLKGMRGMPVRFTARAKG
jgi:cytochrome P450 PksS